MGHSVVNVAELEPGDSGRAVRFVRRALGSGAFGINWFELRPGRAGRERDEPRSGQNEVSVVAGSGHRQVDAEQAAVRRG